uniref:DUF4440 domain-containing protein n=1 Tax=Romanomermis culicivorax TaxID=13658 RepID=A0A915JM41_ROMCU
MADKCITACMSDYVTMWNKKNVSELVEKYYRDTSKVLQPDGSTIRGKAEIVKYMQETIVKCGLKCTLQNDETYGTGDLVTSLGTYKMTDDKGMVVKSGRSVVVWKNGPDGCKIEVDAYTDEKCHTKGVCH